MAVVRWWGAPHTQEQSGGFLVDFWKLFQVGVGRLASSGTCAGQRKGGDKAPAPP